MSRNRSFFHHVEPLVDNLIQAAPKFSFSSRIPWVTYLPRDWADVDFTCGFSEYRNEFAILP